MEFGFRTFLGWKLKLLAAKLFPGTTVVTLHKLRTRVHTDVFALGDEARLRLPPGLGKYIYPAGRILTSFGK